MSFYNRCQLTMQNIQQHSYIHHSTDQKQYHLYVVHSPIVHNQKTENKTKHMSCMQMFSYSMQSLKQSHMYDMHAHIVYII